MRDVESVNLAPPSNLRFLSYLGGASKCQRAERERTLRPPPSSLSSVKLLVDEESFHEQYS